MNPRRFVRGTCFLPGLLVCSSALFATDFYVSPAGSSAGNGSIGSPWNIATACAPATAVRPGDTVWLRGGSYGSGGMSTVNCSLAGNSAAPVVIRNYQGERATILGGLGIYGSYAWYWGLEISNSWTRSTGECGSFPSIKAPDGVFFNPGTTGVKMINMIIHDVANGISDQQEASGTEDYGNLLYNNGWASSCDRGHGHALYLQNNGSAVKLVQDNIGWNSFDIGMQAYGGSANVSNLWFVGNVFFNNGVPGGHRVDNLFIGGGATPKQNILVQDSVMYNPLDATSGETGYNEAINGSNIDITLTNNYWIGANPTGYVTLMLQGWQTTNVTGNMFVGPLSISGVGAYNWSGNSYYKSAPPAGADGGSPVSGSYPTGARVIVRPNKYEPGRAHIIVLNFDKSPTVSVDLSQSGLTGGQSYEIRDAQNFWGGAIASGTYSGGAVSLPMTLSGVSPIINGSAPAHTSAEFGVFVVLPTSGATSVTPTPAPTPAPTPTVAISVTPTSGSVTAGQSQQFSASVTGSSNTAVTWSASAGSMSSTGLFTAPASSQTVTVTATSQADSTKSASAAITVTAPVSSAPSGGGGARWWTFDSTDILGATVIDGSGNGVNGLLFGATPVAGKVNQALSFNGVNSVVTVNSNTALDLLQSMTISTWIRTTNNVRTEDVMGKYDATGTEWGWILKTLPSGVVGLRVGGNNTSGARDVADVTPINDGAWHHVAVVINLGSSVQFYVDGTLRSTQGLPTKGAGNAAPFWIGTIPFTYFGLPFTGGLDNVRVDSQALDASSIAVMAANGGGVTSTPAPAPAPTVAISMTPSTASLAAGQSQQLTATVTGTSNTAVIWAASSGTIANGLYTAPATISTSQSVTVTATSLADGTKSASAVITLIPTSAPSAGPSGAAGSWSFDSSDISGATALDGSGNGLNGVMLGTTAVTGRVNQALSFNGVNSSVTVPANSRLDLVNSMTISGFVKTTNAARTEDLIGKYDATASEWGWIVKTLPSGVVGLRVGGNNTNGARDVADVTPINDGQWHHVAVVINLGSNVQFYIDGVLRSTQALPTKAAGNAAPLWIGGIPFTYFGLPFTGSLDSVRIDAQALSAAAIASLAGGAASTPAPSPTPAPAPAPTPTPIPTPTGTISVSVNPLNTTILSSATQQFTATVSGSSNTAVTWSASSGTISPTGVFSAPNLTSALTVTVQATSQADPTKWGLAMITIIPAGQ